VTKSSDVVIIGGGHNGLVAAAYLSRAGLSVTILEKNETIGGATASQKVFPDYDARLSRYSYLVSLLPDAIVRDLGLSFTTLGRQISSYTADAIGDLTVSREDDALNQSSFASLTGSEKEYAAWQSFYADVQKLADVIAPTMLEKLPTRSELKSKVSDPIWDEIIERPLGEVLESRFTDDLVRGVVFTDGLIGTFADAHDIATNRCFVYHLIGNGTGEWKVPRGGMGGLVAELEALCKKNGVTIVTNAEVTTLRHDDVWNTMTSSGDGYESRFVLANCAPQHLARMLGDTPPPSLDGSQVKVNMLLTKLPRLKSGVDPRIAFAGTFHFDEKYSDLQKAYAQARVGQIPDRIPAEMYCHTLTDTSILSSELAASGFHTLTLFGIHTPASLFDKEHDRVKAEILRRLLSQLNEYLVDPIEECLARAANGSLCIEIKSPLELERDISLPRGNIFHKDLSMPFREDVEAPSWGVETRHPNLYLCGAGAIRGGGVSGIPGHNAAAAVLEQLHLNS